MPSKPERFLDFRATIEKNRQVFSLQHSYAYFAFFHLCGAFDSIGKRLQTGRDGNSKTHVSLLPFALLMERQCMNAFEALSSHRSYEAWVLIRPGLEAALHMGKWVDDPENAAVVLARLNDEFIHMNEPYYTRHITAKPLPDAAIFLGLDYFDADDDIEPHTLAFLHLVAVLIDSVDSMLATLLTNTGPHIPQAPSVGRDLADRTSRLRSLDARHERTLRELGLWFVAAA